jgi:transposase-like protein
LGAEIRSRDRARVAPALPEASDCWHLDEMAMRIAGKRMYLWRAVDHEGEVFDLLIQRRRDSRAALRLMRKLLKKQGFAPKLLVTDKLRSYAAAFRQLGLGCPHEQGLRRNNRAENSHATTRTQAAAVQVGSIRPALPRHARRRSQSGLAATQFAKMLIHEILQGEPSYE